MVAYDLKSRVKAGAWGVVRALADDDESRTLTEQLRQEGLPVVAVPREVAHDPNRRIVTLRSLELHAEQIVLHLRERQMTIPLGALSCIVRGEVHLGHVPARSLSPSSSTFRAVVPGSVDAAMFRESLSPSNFESFAAADLHFATVLWAARIDARSFEFPGAQSGSPASDLDELVDTLAARAQVRVDRGVRASSVVSSLTQPSGAARAPLSISARSKESSTDERFDPYSRLVGEAERQLAQQSAPTSDRPRT
jgi:hypothetical protein